MSTLAINFLILYLSVATNCQPSIIIIGTGPAGIAAASKLLQNSLTNLTILEAENRIGGRINSVKFGESFVDVGAEYCHGQKNNIVYELVKDLNVLEPISATFEPALYYSNGSRMDKKFTEELQAVILGYDSNNFEYNSSGLSIGELFTRKYNATIIQKYSGDTQKIKILNEALRLAEKVSLMIDGAFSWLDTSTLKHYERSEGHQLLVWKGRGYQTILKVLLKEFPNPEHKLQIDNKIQLNQKISKIIWNQSPLIVQTPSNSYSADHIIFTPSVGVLKDQKNSLFSPALPQSKLEAIEAIGIGGVMKIILHFENEWWSDNDVIFSFLWSDEDLLEAAQEFPYGPIKDGISWVSAITVMAKVPGNPKVLVSWITGAFIPEIENTQESILKDGCVYILKKFLGRDYNIREPDQILKSFWRSNPNFRGTYSYERVGFGNDKIRYQLHLAEPLKDDAGSPVVLFAGEATNPVRYSTVHGAIETGFREADRLIELYKKR